MASLFCPKCGQSVRADDEFCRRCGRALDPVESGRSWRWPLWYEWFAGIAVALAIGALVMFAVGRVSALRATTTSRQPDRVAVKTENGIIWVPGLAQVALEGGPVHIWSEPGGTVRCKLDSGTAVQVQSVREMYGQRFFRVIAPGCAGYVAEGLVWP